MSDNSIKYSVTAIIDLLGFSRQLEVADYDLRTNIGQEAVKRLSTLEDSLKILNRKIEESSIDFPMPFYHQRMNDAIIFTMDLSDNLLPSIGNKVKSGLSGAEIDTFTDQEMETFETFLVTHENIFYNNTVSLYKFVGVLARLHNYINRKENESYFPGAKTVIATGFRKPFYDFDNKEDCLSANFSFANAYLAETKLHGPRFFVDTNILELLSHNKYALYIIRKSCLKDQFITFNPFDDIEHRLNSPDSMVETDLISMDIFRKIYSYREINTTPFAYLQVFPRLYPYLNEEKQSLINQKEHRYYFSLFNDIKKGGSKDATKDNIFKITWISRGASTIDDDINILPELVESGKSAKLEEIKNERTKYILHNPLTYKP